MKIKIQSIRDFFKSKEKKGLKPIFFESIGNQNTSRDERLKNLIKVLEKNGFKIKNKKWNLEFTYQRIYQPMQLQKETNRNKTKTLVLDLLVICYKT